MWKVPSSVVRRFSYGSGRFVDTTASEQCNTRVNSLNKILKKLLRSSKQTMRITELQSVIAELRRKLNAANDNKIIEEDEEEEEEDVDDDDAQSRFTSDIENQGAFLLY